MKVQPTSVTNLVKADGGVFYARARHQGRLVWRSLGTSSFTVAKLRLPDALRDIRKIAPSAASVTPKLKFSEAVEIYKAAVNGNPRLASASKLFRLRSEATLRRTWPSVFDMELRRITPEACIKWLNDFENGGSVYRPVRAKQKTRKGNSPTTVNALITFLRETFDVGVKAGICYQNAAGALTRKKATKRLLHLPNKIQFAALVAAIRGSMGWGRVAGDLVEGLTYCGARIDEIRQLEWRHVDFERGMLTIPGSKTAAASRTIPMTSSFRELALRMKSREESFDLGKRVFQAGSALESLKSACAKVGIPKLVHHDLRHLFATSCIESGVDIPTVSRWLGHSDGGALAMRTYGHLRPEHSVEAVKKVQFA